MINKIKKKHQDKTGKLNIINGYNIKNFIL
jgi:hypothetical protein